MSSEKITPEMAATLLWHQGILSWMLHEGQKDLYDSYAKCKEKTIVWSCSRRLGKSFTLCILALETCLQNPNAIVKYCCPKQIDAKNIIRPLIREIITSCPIDLRPEFKTQERAWVFPNGSRIELSGLDGGRAESIRGGSCTLAIVDEAGLVDDLDYIISSILLPTTVTTRGKIILASTPPKSYTHPYVNYVNTARIQGNLVTKTIYDNPQIDKYELQKIIDDYGGESSIAFRREFLCVDEDTLIKTKNGYKAIKDIQIGEKVFTHLGNFKSVTNKFINKLNESVVYEIKCSNNLGLKVTEGHELLITKTDYRRDIDISETQWTKVEEIKCRPSERIYFKVPIDTTKIDFNDINKAYLAGWYVAEGNCGKKNQSVVFSLAHKDPMEDIQKAVKTVFGKGLVTYPSTFKENHAQWYLLSKDAKSYFSQFGTHSTKKKVIDEIKYGSDNVKKSFLSAYFKGDGHYQKEENVLSVVSVCLSLLCDVSDMLLSLGVGCQIKKLHTERDYIILGRKVRLHNSYTLVISGGNLQKFLALEEESRVLSFVKDGFFYSRIKSIKPLLNYKKTYVYDLEVEGDHSYVGLHATFHNCHFIKDDNYAIIPEFTEEVKKSTVKDWPRAPFYDAYVGMDLGLKDLTVALFAWYDFKNDKLIIEDEFVLNGQKFNTQTLADGIRRKEQQCFTDPMTGEEKTPYLRVSDNNLIVINDLWMLHGLRFIATRKDDKDSALNSLRIAIANHKIIINPRCKTLIMHLENGVWNKSKTSYERSENGSHYDSLDALLYLFRNVQFGKNPYPAGFNIGNYQDRFEWGSKPQHPNYDVYSKMFNLNKSKSYSQEQIIEMLNPRLKKK